MSYFRFVVLLFLGGCAVAALLQLLVMGLQKAAV